MTSILGHADILAREIKVPALSQSVDSIRRNARYLLEIITDILDISKIEAGKLSVDCERVSPVDIVADVMALMTVIADEKELQFDVEFESLIPETIASSSIRLRQILVNLLGNAIKFTEEGRVTVKMSTDVANEMLEFHIVDTGIGIPADTLTDLFAPFTQADSSRTRRHGGTGLGLTISRRLARMLGGDVTVVSEVGVGSTFSASVATGPLADVPMRSVDTLNFRETEVDVASEPNEMPISGRILVCDDAREVRFIVQRFLEAAGAEVFLSNNGAEALALIDSAETDRRPFDLVVLDMQMPVLDGYETLDRLRASGNRIPVIALTAHAMDGDREKCLAAGSDAYLAKPIDRTVFLETVAQILDS